MARRLRVTPGCMDGTADTGSVDRAPEEPTQLPKRSWRAVLTGVIREFQDDELTDRAAALTYYGVLSLFPTILVLVSLLGVVGKSAIDWLLKNLKELAPGSARDIISDAVRQLEGQGGVGSLMAVVGIVLAVWASSGYVGPSSAPPTPSTTCPRGGPCGRCCRSGWA